MSAVHHHFKDAIKAINEVIYLYKQNNDVKQLKRLVKLCEIRSELEKMYKEQKIERNKQLIRLES